MLLPLMKENSLLDFLTCKVFRNYMRRIAGRWRRPRYLSRYGMRTNGHKTKAVKPSHNAYWLHSEVTTNLTSSMPTPTTARCASAYRHSGRRSPRIWNLSVHSLLHSTVLYTSYCWLIQGYGIGAVNAMTDGNLLEKLRISRLPAIVAIVEGRVTHYRSDMFLMNARLESWSFYQRFHRF